MRCSVLLLKLVFLQTNMQNCWFDIWVIYLLDDENAYCMICNIHTSPLFCCCWHSIKRDVDDSVLNSMLCSILHMQNNTHLIKSVFIFHNQSPHFQIFLFTAEFQTAKPSEICMFFLHVVNKDGTVFLKPKV